MKQKFRKILIAVFIILFVFMAYFIFKAATVENQKINVKYNSNVSTSGNIETIVSVLDKNENTKKSNLTLQLLDGDNKKVKGAKAKYKINEGDTAECLLAVPENLESGNYKLKITARSGLIISDKKIDINISNKNTSDILISLDKGIYKPGDTINYRALIISKSDNTPKANKEVTVDIFDGNNNKVYSESTSTTEFGIVSGSFTLANEVNSGKYVISVDTNSKKVDKEFTVNPYILPQFEVAIESEKDVYQVGETATITFNAKYFFGEPVANAEVVGKIGKEDFKGLTDNSGNFVYTYVMTDKGEKDIKVSVTDSSNYLIESAKNLYAQEYAFEVETIFENGQINKNVDNNIYIYAKKIDGTPVKVHATAKIGNITRQIITDENGIGKFTLTANDTSSFNGNIVYKISASDNENNSFENSSKIDVVENSVVISTDKIKYNQGDDIEINLDGITDSAKRTVYVCKNGEILKMISTNSESTTVNLDNTSGLIDIFVEGKTNKNNYYYDNTYDVDDDYILEEEVLSRTAVARFPRNYDYYGQIGFIRKTIFIKPAKNLDIAISTDKDEYKPGESLNLNFKVQNEKNEKIDANILVSILDEAVLSLAENDLSIDNIRLALKDIQLTEDITAADLYAEVLDNKSESKLTLALLKNNSVEPTVKEDQGLEHYSYEYKQIVFILALGIAFVLMLYVSLSESSKLKNIFEDIINVLTLAILLFAMCGEFISDLFDSNEFIKAIIITFIVAIMAYCLAIYKKRDKVFNLIKKLIVMPGIFIGALYLLYEFLDVDNDILLFCIFAVPVLMTILIVINRKHKLNKFWNWVKNLTISLVEVGVAYFIAAAVTSILFDNPICFIIVAVIVYWGIEKIYNRKKTNAEPPDKPLNITQIVVTGIFVLILIWVTSITRNFSGNVTSDYRTDDFHGGLYPEVAFNAAEADGSTNFDFSDAKAFINKGTDSASTNKGFSGFGDILNSTKDNISNDSKPVTQEVERENVTQSAENTETEEMTENVRNVFLESLAFIPDLVVKDGSVSKEIKLSDNITTWNIQAIGNTKDGSIGSSSATFKVFKEFFVDFSLPTNSVVTDKINIPITIYNYKETPLIVNLNVASNDWSNIGNYAQSITIDSNATQLIYIPLEITKAGNNTLRVEAKADGVSDIVERTLTVTPNGYKKTKVISTSTIDKSFETDYFTTEEAIENTRKLKVKVYPSAISQAIEGMENILQMPTGCFEQTSSSLYPDILALKYLNDNNLDNEKIREQALEYISTGYQRLLTFEVPGEKGGYSLFGDTPAEPVLTAFGAMELNDATEVYDIDEQVINNMIEYLFKEQKIDGSFNIHNSYLETGTASSSDLAMNAYITWALSEIVPNDERLQTSISYLEGKINKADDNYTLALMANVFANTNGKETKSVINKLMENVTETNDSAYITSNIRDYYGTYGTYQNLQVTALTSMALTKTNLHSKTNNSLIKYITSNKDSFGNWGTTQATILSLKAINMASNKGKISGQTIQVSLNGETKDIKVSNNPLDIYELEFDDVKDENKISFNMKKGNLTYELIEEYYVSYKSIEEAEKDSLIDITQTINAIAKVNDTIIQTISITNKSNDSIANGIVRVNIPQGCSVNEIYLERLVATNIIEKYEYNYSTLNLYLRNFKLGETKNIEVYYRANYPEAITGGAIRVYDYYNPEIEGVEGPVEIIVTE